MPFSQFFGFLMNACMMCGMLSSALEPRTDGFTGTSLQPRNSRFSSFRTCSKVFIAFSYFALVCGKKNIPIPYSRLSPIGIFNSFATLEKYVCEICSKMPTPSPVFPSASFPALCSRVSTIFRALSTTLRSVSPFIFTTAPIPQFSCSNRGS